MMKYAGKEGDCHSVICNRNVLLLRCADALQDISSIKHTGTAMNDEIIRRQILWKIASIDKRNLQSFA